MSLINNRNLRNFEADSNIYFVVFQKLGNIVCYLNRFYTEHRKNSNIHYTNIGEIVCIIMDTKLLREWFKTGDTGYGEAYYYIPDKSIQEIETAFKNFFEFGTSFDLKYTYFYGPGLLRRFLDSKCWFNK